MGSAPAMNYLGMSAVVLAAYFVPFLEASVNGLRNWLGAQVDLGPALMVYAGLTAGLGTVGLTAIVGGLCFDALSANPLGISILPLFLIGMAVHLARELVLRDQGYARIILGAAASAVGPALTVLLLLGGGYKPLIGWGSLWQWIVMAVVGGVLTPVCFWVFDRINALLSYSQTSESTFRPDREIKRGRL